MAPTSPPRPSPQAEVTPPRPGELRRARAVARVLDDLIPIPGTSWRIGIDPLLGLFPGVGDWVGWAASLHLLLSAWRAGADAATLVRMAGNMVIDALVGAVPVLGDLFDMAWKANDRNLRILEGVVAEPADTRRSSRWVVGSVVAGTVTLLGLASIGALLVLRAVVGAVSGLF